LIEFYFGKDTTFFFSKSKNAKKNIRIREFFFILLIMSYLKIKKTIFSILFGDFFRESGYKTVKNG